MTDTDVNLSMDTNEYSEYFAVLRSMHDRVPWHPKEKAPEHHLLAKLNGVYLFSQFGSSLVRTGSSSVGFGEAEGLFQNAQGAAHALSSGFSIAKLALTIVDFIRIPLTYMVAWQLGQNPELSVSKKAKWLYSGILMGLAITAMAAPITAVPIAITTAVLGLGSSIFALAKFLYAKHECKKELHQVKEQLEGKESDVEKLRAKATHLEEQLQEAIKKQDREAVEALGKEIKQISSLYHDGINEVQGLKDKQHALEMKLERKGAGALLDKTVGFGLASLGLIGITVSLFFPPIGLGLLLGAVGGGLLYGIGRVSAPLVSRFFNFVRSNFSSVPETTEGTPTEEQPQLQSEKNFIHESTADVIKELSEHEPAHHLHTPQVELAPPTEEAAAQNSAVAKLAALIAHNTPHPPQEVSESEREEESEQDGEGWRR